MNRRAFVIGFAVCRLYSEYFMPRGRQPCGINSRFSFLYSVFAFSFFFFFPPNCNLGNVSAVIATGRGERGGGGGGRKKGDEK